MAKDKKAIGAGAIIVVLLALLYLGRRVRPREGGQVFGKIVDEAGEPLSSVIVRFVSIESAEWTGDVETDLYGLFTKDVPAGKYTVSFIKTGYYATDRTVTVTTPYATGLGTIVMYGLVL